jgi:hypothetical protein
VRERRQVDFGNETVMAGQADHLLAEHGIAHVYTDATGRAPDELGHASRPAAIPPMYADSRRTSPNLIRGFAPSILSKFTIRAACRTGVEWISVQPSGREL